MPTYYAVQVDPAPSNVLPGGIAGSALVCGDLVYMDSNGTWQKAQAVNWARDLVANITRKDAVGICWKAAQANEVISPVKRMRIRNSSGQTIGGILYLSATAGAWTQTAPYMAQVRQPVGIAVSASEILFDIDVANALASIDVGHDALVFTGVAGEAITQYNLCGITAAGLIVKADASTAAVIVAVGVALAAISDEATGSLYDNCNIVVSGKTAGTPLWTGETAGAIDESAPGDTGDLIQPVGVTIGAISQYISVDRNPALSA